MALSEQQKQALRSTLASPGQSTSVDRLSVTNQSACEIIRALQFAASVESLQGGCRLEVPCQPWQWAGGGVFLLGTGPAASL